MEAQERRSRALTAPPMALGSPAIKAGGRFMCKIIDVATFVATLSS